MAVQAKWTHRDTKIYMRLRMLGYAHMLPLVTYA